MRMGVCFFITFSIAELNICAVCDERLVSSGEICLILHPLIFVVLTIHQVWGVTEEYLKTNVFPDASNSVLGTLGSVAGMVRQPTPNLCLCI